MRMDQALAKLEKSGGPKEQKDYFIGLGAENLSVPTNIFLFLRNIKNKVELVKLQTSRCLHTRFVLVFNFRAEGHVHLDHLELPLGPGQALLIHPHQLHYFFSHEKSLPLRWLFCTFDMESGDSLEPLRNRIIILQDRSFRALEELLDIWHEEPSELQESLLQATLLRLLILVKKDQRQTLASDLLPEPEESLMRTVSRLLSERREAMASDLAEILNLSESHLRTRFKKISGIPLSSYIRNHRINHAMTLLRTTDLSIASVAEEAGFGSPQAFCHTFKQELKQSPRDYRKAR